ncbi:hypothetical protein BASA61_002808 [Batrachochytrium salamandrivorans]|nr:hypothetical protein BASA61_002808 [Batrachochytrium salamandrivorans]
MKVSILVAAAMVITSVNAGRKREFKSFLKKVGGMTGSESKANLVIDDDLESGSSQDSSVHGARQRPSQIPLARRLRSILPPKSLMHNPESELAEKLVIDDDPESEPPQKSQRHEPRPGPSQSSLGHRLRSALSSKSPVYKLPHKKGPICGPIIEELRILWDKICDLNHEFMEWNPEFYDLLMVNGGEMSEDYDGIREDDDLIAEQIQKWIESHPEAISKLQEIKAKSSSLEKDHGEVWKRFKDNRCPTKFLKHFSPKEMLKLGYFFIWKDARGADILGEQ